MSTAQTRAVRSYRQRLRQRGLVRLEIQAPATDAPWIRRLAGILRDDPERAKIIRRQIREAVGEPADRLDAKELLAAAPLDGIDLTRSKDRGREVDL